MNNIPQIFCNNKLKLHKKRSFNLKKDDDFLTIESSNRIIDRLQDLSGDFEHVLNMTKSKGYLSNVIKNTLKPKFIEEQNFYEESQHFTALEPKKFDLIVNNLFLHNINDVPGVLIKINRSLKENGMFIATMFGGTNLNEFKKSLNHAEIKVKGGVSPRFSPVVDVKTIGSLLQQTGFKLPVADSEIVKVAYDDIYQLTADLRSMGETNALKQKFSPLNKEILKEANKYYLENFSDNEGGIIASFDIITITGMRC